MIKVPRPHVSGGDIPEPFNSNDEKVWIDRILKTMCRLSEKRCFYPSEFVLEDEMQTAGAYASSVEKETALSDQRHPYHRLATHCLARLGLSEGKWESQDLKQRTLFDFFRPS